MVPRRQMRHNLALRSKMNSRGLAFQPGLWQGVLQRLLPLSSSQVSFRRPFACDTRKGRGIVCFHSMGLLCKDLTEDMCSISSLCRGSNADGLAEKLQVAIFLHLLGAGVEGLHLANKVKIRTAERAAEGESIRNFAIDPNLHEDDTIQPSSLHSTTLLFRPAPNLFCLAQLFTTESAKLRRTGRPPNLLRASAAVWSSSGTCSPTNPMSTCASLDIFRFSDTSPQCCTVPLTSGYLAVGQQKAGGYNNSPSSYFCSSSHERVQNHCRQMHPVETMSRCYNKQNIASKYSSFFRFSLRRYYSCY